MRARLLASAVISVWILAAGVGEAQVRWRARTGG